jgi:hypothetical protein
MIHTVYTYDELVTLLLHKNAFTNMSFDDRHRRTTNDEGH